MVRSTVSAIVVLFSLTVAVAADERTDAAREVLRGAIAQLESKIQKIEDFLARARIGDPEVLALYRSQIEAMQSSIAFHSDVLRSGDDALLVAAAKVVVRETIAAKYEMLQALKEDARNNEKAEPRSAAVRKELEVLQAKMKTLEG